MVISQSEIYWLDFGPPKGSEPGYRRPCVVIQNNTANQSAINTTIVCVITTNLALGAIRGNVPLGVGEGGLAKRSVVNASQVYTVDKRRLEERIGAVSPERVGQTLAGLLRFLDPSQPNNQ